MYSLDIDDNLSFRTFPVQLTGQGHHRFIRQLECADAETATHVWELIRYNLCSHETEVPHVIWSTV